jgi:hypothetical protein
LLDWLWIVITKHNELGAGNPLVYSYN